MTRARPSAGEEPVPGAGTGSARVIVVFEDRAAAAGFRWLRAGFRHCFCLLRRPVGWIVCDPLKSRTHLDVIMPYDEHDLLLNYSQKKLTALVGHCLDAHPKIEFLRPLTCVEIVKRVVGLRAPMVWTPYQLFRALCRLGFAPGLEARERAIDNVPN